ncbi:response regulator [Thiocystis minor]|uniref:response regulator n=1 Tax=Thiocystis minor TaxID=61597 RepID=UPI001913C164|nr:response regulator [Thiocystis minor]MBK5963996.1 response regulator [Thiocystis minor]
MRRLNPNANPPAQDVSATSVSSVTATVLVVDDSPTETRILFNTLTKAGYRVETAANGEEGVDAARRLHPDVILMDVIMPVLNGFQATRILRGDVQTANIPIIMVTTKDMKTDRTWGLRQGANDYLVKPVDRQLLLERIRILLGA